MKQVFCFFAFLFVFFGFSVSDASVRIKPKTVAVTPADVMSYQIIKAGQWTNALKNPNHIEPGWNLFYPLPDGSDTTAKVAFGDNQTFIVKRIINARNLLNPDLAQNEPRVIPQVKPASYDSNSVLAVETKGFDFLFWLIVAFCVILIIALLNLVQQSIKNKEKYEKELKAERKILEITENELELTKQKLPIEAPALADENWLKTNNPVESHQTDTNSLLLPSASTMTRVFGKKPDLIGQALVSTKDNATIMDFSFGRKANTGLKDVAVWLGWNWATKKGSKKKGWVPVGMIASVCSNGFEVNPEKVKSLDQLFTKVELANKGRNPVAYLNPDVPANVKFPELLAGLVVKYHEGNIADLRKAGAVINLPNK